jgi:hypothetical protein
MPEVKTLLLIPALPALLLAQWPAYHSPQTPRKPGGQPNLEAPAPKTADGKPDLSGVWENIRPSGAPATPIGARPNNQFWNIGFGLKDGLPFQPWAADLLKKRMAENSKDNPDAHCLPLGFMQLHTHPQPRKMIQSPDVIVIVYEANSGLRQIFTDGRPLPDNDAEPWWYGYSTGKWDGDTLVVQTVGFRDDVWLDVNGSPLTSRGKVTERFRRPNYGNLEIEITVDDPKAYTRPWTVKIAQRIMPDTELIEFICQENERSAPHLVGK